MTDVVARARAALSELLAEIGIPHERDARGDFIISDGPLVAHARLTEAEGRAVLDVTATVRESVEVTPELLRFVAEEPFLFGRLRLEERGDRSDLVFGHTLLADPLTTDVVLQVLGIIISTPPQLLLPGS